MSEWKPGDPKTWEDFNWKTYPTLYREQLEDTTYDYLIESFTAGEELEVHNNIHQNALEIYQTAYKLKPKTIFEVGAGACYHLMNIKQFLSDSQVSGCDINHNQVELGVEFYNLPDDIKNRISIADFSSPGVGASFTPQEFVFTQAVVMHASEEKAAQMIKNMGLTSSKYILLMESSIFHPWERLIDKSLPQFERYKMRAWNPANLTYEDQEESLDKYRHAYVSLSMLLRRV